MSKAWARMSEALAQAIVSDAEITRKLSCGVSNTTTGLGGTGLCDQPASDRGAGPARTALGVAYPAGTPRWASGGKGAPGPVREDVLQRALPATPGTRRRRPAAQRRQRGLQADPAGNGTRRGPRASPRLGQELAGANGQRTPTHPVAGTMAAAERRPRDAGRPQTAFVRERLGRECPRGAVHDALAARSMTGAPNAEPPDP